MMPPMMLRPPPPILVPVVPSPPMVVSQRCTGDGCTCISFRQGSVSATYCTCGHCKAWHSANGRKASVSVAVSSGPRTLSISTPTSPSASPSSSPKSRTTSLTQPPSATKALVDQRRPSVVPPPIPADLLASASASASGAVHPALSKATSAPLSEETKAKPQFLRVSTGGTMYASYLKQHGLMSHVPPPPPPIPRTAGGSISVPPPVPAALLVRQTLSIPPSPIPSSPFSPSSGSTHSPASRTSSTSDPVPPLISPKLMPPVPIFSPSISAPAASPASSSLSAPPPALPPRMSPMKQNRPPPILAPAGTATTTATTHNPNTIASPPPILHTDPPTVSSLLAASSPTAHPPPSDPHHGPAQLVPPPSTYAPLIADAFATHLHHRPDVVAQQSQAGLHVAKRVRSFVGSYAQLLARHAADVEKLVGYEMAKLLALQQDDEDAGGSGDGMGGMGTVYQSLLMKIGSGGVRVAQYGAELQLQCIEPLERMYEVAHSMGREHEGNVKKHVSAVDKINVTVAKEREVTRQALAQLAHDKKKQEATKGDIKASHRAAIDAARRKALKCCEAYERAIDAANVAHNQHAHCELPALMTQMQSLEEMRLQSLHAALTGFAGLQTEWAEGMRTLGGDVKALVGSLHTDNDIRGFIARVIQEHGPPLPSQPFYYDMAITTAELRHEIEAEEKAHASAAAGVTTGGSGGAVKGGRQVSLFYTTLEGVMEYERLMFEDSKEGSATALPLPPACSKYPPGIPHILPVLLSAIESLGGFTAEGIFRLSVSSDELLSARKRLEKGDYILSSIDSPHVPAALLKAWLRDLSSPLIPSTLYTQAIELGKLSPSSFFDALPAATSHTTALTQLVASLPPLSRRVLYVLLVFLCRLSDPVCVEASRMSVMNLAIVFAPGLLRSEGVDAVAMLRDSKYACQLVAHLIEMVRREVGWDEEREWWRQWEGKSTVKSPSSSHQQPPALPVPFITAPRPSVPASKRPSVCPPPVPTDYLSPSSSPPESPGRTASSASTAASTAGLGGVARGVRGVSFADRHAALAPSGAVLDAATPVVVHGLSAVKTGSVARNGVDTGGALPAEWRAQLDPATQEMYYYNVVTMQTQWAKPS